MSRFFSFVTTLGAIIVLLVVIYLTGAFHPLAVFVDRVETNILSAVHSAETSFQIMPFNLEDRIKLTEENRMLRQERDEILTKLIDIKALQTENAFLRKQLSYNPPKRYATTLGEIIGHPISDPSLLLVNRGKGDMIHEGDAVMSDTGMLIGRIAETGERVSKIIPITVAGSEVGVTILADKSVDALLEGSHGLGTRIIFLPLQLSVTHGTPIVTSGVEPGVPSGLPVGQVDALTKAEGQLFQEASVVSAVAPQEVRFVTILTLHDVQN